MKLSNVEEFECCVCERIAIRATKARPGRRTRANVCRVGAITCSNICARKYRANIENIKKKQYRKKIRLENDSKHLNRNDNI